MRKTTTILLTMPLLVGACGGGKGNGGGTSTAGGGSNGGGTSSQLAVGDGGGAGSAHIYACPLPATVSKIVGVTLDSPEVENSTIDPQTQLDLGCNYLPTGSGQAISDVVLSFNNDVGRAGWEANLSSTSDDPDNKITQLTGFGQAADLVQTSQGLGINALYGSTVINVSVSGPAATVDQAKQLLTLASRA